MTINRRISAETDGGVGDLTDILHNKGVADLSWLRVDEDEYRKLEALPRQNLDIIPELEHALRQEPMEVVPQVIPMKPVTVVNQNPISRSIISDTPIRNRTSQLVMAGTKPKDIKERLMLEFAESDLRRHVSAIKEVMDERGLLGKVYVNSFHFPRCAQGDGKDFVRKHCAKSLYVLAKKNCAGCVHARGGRCSVFQKRIVGSVPYDTRTLQHYTPGADASGNVKGQLRAAFLQGPRRVTAEPILQARTQRTPAKIQPTRAQVQNYLARSAQNNTVKMPGSAYIGYARRMMEGHNDTKLLLSSTDPEIKKLANEYGLMGHTYIDIDALGGCKKATKFVNDKGLTPEYSVYRSGGCGACSKKCGPSSDCGCVCHCTKVVSSTPELAREDFERSAVKKYKQSTITENELRRVASNLGRGGNWTKLTAQMNLYKPVRKSSTVEYTQGNSKAFHGHPGTEGKTEKMDPKEMRRSISHLMNQGLKGQKLRDAILSRYTREDLAQDPGLGKIASANEGVQGFYFIDPSAYKDYGKGCARGASSFRKRGASYVLAGSACTGCQLQTAPGWCSKYSKEIIREVPPNIVTAHKKVALPVVTDPVENPVETYELESEMNIQPGKRPAEFDMQLESPTLGMEF